MNDLQAILGERKVNGVVCVAGGWAGGNAASKGVPLATVTPSSHRLILLRHSPLFVFP